ncbi:MAG TPA: hypothetical protein VNO70_22150 [Blastocatellia bacterium]|nr:hypothetical protein [Blastocatellia bacterium]
MKKPASLFLILALTAVFSFSSFAAPEVNAPAAAVDFDALFVQQPSGTITVSGEVKINDNKAESGATVMNESVIETEEDGDALIDLGPLGRIQLRPNSKIKLNLSANSCIIDMEECGSLTHTVPAGVTSEVRMKESKLTQVSVYRGEARVNGKVGQSQSDGTLVRATEVRNFDSLSNATATGEATYTVNCCECALATGGGFFFPVWGFLGLAGAAAGVATGIQVGDEPDPVSPTQP